MFYQTCVVVPPGNCFAFTPTVSEKHFLESETGLKIVQSGVGEVRKCHRKPQRAPENTRGRCRGNGCRITAAKLELVQTYIP